MEFSHAYHARAIVALHPTLIWADPSDQDHKGFYKPVNEALLEPALSFFGQEALELQWGKS